MLKWIYTTTGTFVDSSPVEDVDGKAYVGSGGNKLDAINSNGTKGEGGFFSYRH